MMVRRVNVVALLALSLTFGLSGTATFAATDQYYGRWTVSDEKPAYSSKGILYKTIDVAPCGKDFCGVSVADDSSCGEVLFRFFADHEDREELTGHGKWGKVKKKLQLGIAAFDDEAPFMYVALGSEDMDISGREGSIPTFEASYKRLGEVVCTAD